MQIVLLICVICYVYMSVHCFRFMHIVMFTINYVHSSQCSSQGYVILLLWMFCVIVTPHTVQPQFTVFARGPQKECWIWENGNVGAYSLNRICSGTTEVGWWTWENNTSWNDRLRFHCISMGAGSLFWSLCNVWNMGLCVFMYKSLCH
jgi:hypothetical protein